MCRLQCTHRGGGAEHTSDLGEVDRCQTWCSGGSEKQVADDEHHHAAHVEASVEDEGNLSRSPGAVTVQVGGVKRPCVQGLQDNWATKKLMDRRHEQAHRCRDVVEQHRLERRFVCLDRRRK